MLFAMVGIDCILPMFALESVIAARFNLSSHDFVLFISLPLVLARFALVIVACIWSLNFAHAYDFRLHLCEIAIRLLRAFSLAFLTLSAVYFIVLALALGGGITEITMVLAAILTLSWRAMFAQPPKMTSARF